MTEIEQQKEKKQKKKKDPEEKSTLQRSKTFVNLLFKGGRKKDASRGRSKSPGDKSAKGSADLFRPARAAVIVEPNRPISSCCYSERQTAATANSEMLGVVEDMARRLLTEEEAAAAMKACRLVRRFGSHCRQKHSQYAQLDSTVNL